MAPFLIIRAMKEIAFMTKKFARCLTIAAFIGAFASCKKNDSKDDNYLPTVTTGSTAHLTNSSVVVTGNAFAAKTSAKEIGICFATTANPTTDNDKVIASPNNMGDFSVTLTGLKAKTMYHARAYAIYQNETSYGADISFTTAAIGINYNKFYDFVNASRYYSPLQIFSVENGVHKIYGSGFSQSPVTVKLIEKANTSNVTLAAVTVLDDSTLTFQIPSDIIPQTPYAAVKEYFFTINDMPFESLHGRINGGIGDTAQLIINNKDINIDTISKYAENGCPRFIIKGVFASATGAYTHNPAYLLGVPTQPTDRKLAVKVNGVFFNEYKIPNGQPSCGNAVMQNDVYSSPIYIYQEPMQVALKETLPSGNISMQVVNTMADGSEVKSNEYTFTNQ